MGEHTHTNQFKQKKTTKIHPRTHDEEAGSEEDGLHLDVQIDGEVDAEVVRIGEGLAHETGPLLRHFAHLRGAVGRVPLPPPSPPPPKKKYQKHERFHGESRWPKQKKQERKTSKNGVFDVARSAVVPYCGAWPPRRGHSWVVKIGVAKLFGPQAICRNLDEGAGHTT